MGQTFVAMQGVFQKFVNKYVWNTEERGVSLDNPKQVINGWALDQLFGGVSKSGHSITSESILTLSAVYRAVAIKSGIISSAPFKVYRKTPEGRIEVSNKISYGKYNKVTYFDRATQHFELKGNHFAFIKKNGIGRVVGYDLIHPDHVEVLEGENSVVYRVHENGTKEIYGSDKIIHVPNMGSGVIGKSVIGYMKDDVSLMFDVRGYGDSFYGSGGKPASLLLPKMGVTLAQREEMKKSFKEAKSNGGDVAMPFGWEYKEISVPPAEADWILTNNFSVANIGRWFGVPTQKLGDSAVKYSNVESMGIEFLQDTMSPIAAKFECEYTNKTFMLSTEEEMYYEFNLDGYLRADSETRAKLYATYIQNGIKKPNEIRKLNNDPADPFGDDLMIQGATVPIKMQQQLKAAPVARKSSLRKQIESQVKDGVDPQLIIEGIFSNDGKGY